MPPDSQETYSQLVEEGITSKWSGRFTVFGFKVSLKPHVTYVVATTTPGYSCSSDHMDFLISNKPERSHYSLRGNWSVEKAGNSPIFMYPAFDDPDFPEMPPYTKEQIVNTIAHEFGHALGVGDAYYDSTGEDGETVSKPHRDPSGNEIVSIFSSSSTPVQNRDLEMVLLAHSENQFQNWEFVPKRGKV